MSFSVVDTINTVNEYKQKVGSRLFYLNGPANIISARQGLQFIESLLSRTSSPEIKFKDYDEMLLYGNSIEQLKKIISLPEIGSSQGKCIKYISNLRKDGSIEQKMGEMEKSALTNYNQNSLSILKRQAQTMFDKNSKGVDSIKYDFQKPVVIWTKESLKAEYTHWLNKQSQIIIPGNYQYEANKIISNFMPIVSSLDDKKKNEVYAFLNNLKFADTLYKTDRDQNNKMIAKILARLDARADRYGDNIFFSIIDIVPDEYLSITKMEYWNSDATKLNSMFTLDKNMIGNGINQILNGALQKQKMDQAAQKQKDAEEAMKNKEKKEKEEKENKEKEYIKNLEPEDIKQNIFETLDQVDNHGNIINELEGNTENVNSKNYSNEESILASVSQSISREAEIVKNLINNG